MKLCNYAQNNSEMYLSVAACFNIDLKLISSGSALFIYQYGQYNSPLVGLLIQLSKTFPSTLVMPLYKSLGYMNIMNRYFSISKSINLFDKYAKAVREDILEINLL